MPAELEFYIGRAGTGKTRAVYAALMQTQGAALFVPEQFTYEAERELSHTPGALPGVQVYSLSRLAERIIHAQDKPYLSIQGRRMVVRRAAYQLKSKLSVFAEVSMRRGFAERMNALLSAMKLACLKPEDILKAAQTLGERSALYLKLKDIALLYENVQGYLDAHFIDNEDAQAAVLRVLPTSPLAGRHIYFDGFDAVNEQLYATLTQFLLIGRKLVITLCMDPDPDARDAALFAPERAVYERVYELARSLGCRVSERYFETELPTKDPVLIRLESELFALNPRPMTGVVEALALVGARDRVREVDALADAVHRAAREGVRYRDMAVIASDMQAYAPMVQRAFELRDIPLFLDARRSMQGHPVVELTLSALHAASGLGAAALIRLIKTGLTGIDRDEGEAFENYVLARGLRGGKVFLSPFTDEVGGAETARLKLIPPLTQLMQALLAPTAAQKTRALYAYLEHLKVRESLHALAQRLRAEGRYALMEEHAQVFGILMELLEQFHFILGQNEMSTREFREVLSEALDAYQVGIIPATADQVLFGDFYRTRSRRVQRLFLLGCNEGLLLSPRLDQEIIDDAELDMLKSTGLRLWPGVLQLERADSLALYRALNKATQMLYMGFAYSDGTKELVPARLVDDVKRLFPGLREREVNVALPECARSGFFTLTRSLGEKGALIEAMRRYYSAHTDYEARLKKAQGFSLAPHTPEQLGEPLARRLYGSKYYGSVSRLETFRACPYKYFLSYGVKLRPRREFQERAGDIGSFSHHVLERFLREVSSRGLSFRAITREEADALLDELFPECLEAYENGLLAATPRARALSGFYRKALSDTVWALIASIRCGSFEPMGGELRFGQDGTLPALTLPGANATLSGIIDRVDIAYDADGQAHLRVIDYKTGFRSLRFDAINDGMAMQLAIYLYAIRALGKLDGMYYQPIYAPVADEGEEDQAQDMLRLTGFTRAEEDAIALTEHELTGHSEAIKGLGRNRDNSLKKTAPVLTEEELYALIDFTAGRAAQIANELLAGKVEARPASFGRAGVCQNCDYGSVCRFDARLQGCRTRKLPRVDKRGFFDSIGILNNTDDKK